MSFSEELPVYSRGNFFPESQNNAEINSPPISIQPPVYSSLTDIHFIQEKFNQNNETPTPISNHQITTQEIIINERTIENKLAILNNKINTHRILTNPLMEEISHIIKDINKVLLDCKDTKLVKNFEETVRKINSILEENINKNINNPKSIFKKENPHIKAIHVQSNVRFIICYLKKTYGGLGDIKVTKYNYKNLDANFETLSDFFQKNSIEKYNSIIQSKKLEITEIKKIIESETDSLKFLTLLRANDFKGIATQMSKINENFINLNRKDISDLFSQLDISQREKPEIKNQYTIFLSICRMKDFLVKKQQVNEFNYKEIGSDCVNLLKFINDSSIPINDFGLLLQKIQIDTKEIEKEVEKNNWIQDLNNLKIQITSTNNLPHTLKEINSNLINLKNINQNSVNLIRELEIEINTLDVKNHDVKNQIEIFKSINELLKASNFNINALEITNKNYQVLETHIDRLIEFITPKSINNETLNSRLSICKFAITNLKNIKSNEFKDKYEQFKNIANQNPINQIQILDHINKYLLNQPYDSKEFTQIYDLLKNINTKESNVLKRINIADSIYNIKKMSNNGLNKILISSDNYIEIENQINKLFETGTPLDIQLFSTLQDAIIDISILTNQNKVNSGSNLLMSNLKLYFDNQNPDEALYQTILFDLSYLMNTNPEDSNFQKKETEFLGRLNDTSQNMEVKGKGKKRDYMEDLQKDLVIVNAAKNQIMELAKSLIEKKIRRSNNKLGTLEEEIVKKQARLNELFDLLEDVDLQKLSSPKLQGDIATLILTEDREDLLYKAKFRELIEEIGK